MAINTTVAPAIKYQTKRVCDLNDFECFLDPNNANVILTLSDGFLNLTREEDYNRTVYPSEIYVTIVDLEITASRLLKN